MSSSINKTQPTAQNVEDFLAALPSEKQSDSQRLIEIMRGISGELPVLWGPSIIGFGSRHYKYETGREGDTPAIGFSPRKAAITIYIMEGFEAHRDLLARLGRHTTSVSCLYVKKLADVDIAVLRELLGRSYSYVTTDHKPAPSMDHYIASAPELQRSMLQQIRGRVHELAPAVTETISYQIPAFKLDGRILVYMAAWKDHISIYPIPVVDEALQAELVPYVKGRGTLWFGLKKPLPLVLVDQLIVAYISAHQLRRRRS